MGNIKRYAILVVILVMTLILVLGFVFHDVGAYEQYNEEEMCQRERLNELLQECIKATMKGKEDMIHALRKVKEEVKYVRRQFKELNERLDQVESSCRTIDLQLG